MEVGFSFATSNRFSFTYLLVPVSSAGKIFCGGLAPLKASLSTGYYEVLSCRWNCVFFVRMLLILLMALCAQNFLSAGS
jgi:hypothetical protein